MFLKSAIQCDSKYIYWEYDPNEEKYKDLMAKLILQHHFNHQVEIFYSSDTTNAPQMDEMKAEIYQVRFPLHCILNQNFIKQAKEGKYTAMSINTKLDSNNSAAMLPNGIFYLRLNRESYERFGLEGKKSQFPQSKNIKSKNNRGSESFYLIEIDLKDPRLSDRGEHFERVQSCLEKLGLIEMLFIFTNHNHPSPFDCAALFGEDKKHLIQSKIVKNRYKNKIR